MFSSFVSVPPDDTVIFGVQPEVQDYMRPNGTEGIQRNPQQSGFLKIKINSLASFETINYF
jgi:hypothetical protein